MRTSQTWKLPTCDFTNSDTSNVRFHKLGYFQHAVHKLGQIPTCVYFFKHVEFCFFHVHANLPPIQKTACCIPRIRML
ncbi:hypothetical protein HanXRQr2_Chr11g0492001 [Helianthus annuus]|uniref:Uncharacterized protein n=1 Tax=Helianthus annuus TaxID=4232 RepID=A0A9K3N0N1_HELAN|nr:hypothetical protein HanXRQr2_Chr11g0492001 [Helianthus annuus]KAJ0875263.1 hypothetical protein HanPSC8_Chr11g0474121 [Helianthus annuus]